MRLTTKTPHCMHYHVSIDGVDLTDKMIVQMADDGDYPKPRRGVVECLIHDPRTPEPEPGKMRVARYVMDEDRNGPQTFIIKGDVKIWREDGKQTP